MNWKETTDLTEQYDLSCDIHKMQNFRITATSTLYSILQEVIALYADYNPKVMTSRAHNYIYIYIYKGVRKRWIVSSEWQFYQQVQPICCNTIIMCSTHDHDNSYISRSDLVVPERVYMNEIHWIMKYCPKALIQIKLHPWRIYSRW